jgi:hypothetical protein
MSRNTINVLIYHRHKLTYRFHLLFTLILQTLIQSTCFLTEEELGKSCEGGQQAGYTFRTRVYFTKMLVSNRIGDLQSYHILHAA